MLYKKPFDFYSFFTSLDASKNTGQDDYISRSEATFVNAADLTESIDHVIELILFSHPGECTFFYDFSFGFWGKHFNNISVEYFNNTQMPKSLFEKQLKHAITKYESRLTNVGVEIFLSEKGVDSKVKYNDFSVHVNITGNYKFNPDQVYKKAIVFSAGTMQPRN